MAYSTQRATSDGTMVLLALSLEYFDRSEISVYFNGVVNALPWAWVGSTDKTLAFSPAVPNTVEVLVKRTTNIATPRHQFSAGAAFTSESIDEGMLQILHIAQESSEGAGLGEVFQDLDFHGFKAKNIAPATAAGEALEYSQLASQTAAVTVIKDQAVSSANAAAASAVAADLSAQAAAASALSISTDIAGVTHAATTKATPDDTDEVGYWDNVSGLLRKLTWSNTKAALKTYFDSLYKYEARGTVVMHATTMDLWAQPSIVDGTGTAVTITAIANAPQAGARRVLYPVANSVLTHGSMFTIDGNANQIAAAGDRWEFEATAVDAYKVHVTKKSGSSVTSAIVLGTTVSTTFTGSLAITSAAHGLGAVPTGISGYMECLVNDADYVVGDRVLLSGTYFWCNATTLGITIIAGSKICPRKDGTANFTMTNNSWKFVATPYK